MDQRGTDPEEKKEAVTALTVKLTGWLLTGNTVHQLVENRAQNTGKSKSKMNEFQSEVFLQVHINIM